MEKTTLSNIVVAFSQIEQELIESGGELSPSLEAFTLDLTGKLEDKIEAYHAVMERASMGASYYKAKADEYNRIAKGLAKSEDFLKQNLKAALETLELTEVKAGSVRVKLAKCPQRLVIDNEATIPQEFVELVPKVLTGPLKAALESGLEVQGAHLEGGTALRFYANREMK